LCGFKDAKYATLAFISSGVIVWETLIMPFTDPIRGAELVRAPLLKSSSCCSM
jgi:hypothetical protein